MTRENWRVVVVGGGVTVAAVGTKKTASRREALATAPRFGSVSFIIFAVLLLIIIGGCPLSRGALAVRVHSHGLSGPDLRVYAAVSVCHSNLNVYYGWHLQPIAGRGAGINQRVFKHPHVRRRAPRTPSSSPSRFLCS